jgi:hypothetical protein
MNTYRLPPKVFESNLPKFLGALAHFEADDEPLVLDLKGVEYWIPAAIVALCAMVNRWTERGRGIYFENHNDCPACAYLQRMDFFDRVGLRLPEYFVRRDAGTSFVEIEQVVPGIARLRDPLAGRLAACLAGTKDPTNDALRFAEFALGEVIANCQQHAEKPGFVTAQYVASRDWARIGVADYGIGIRESFRKAGSPHYRRGMTHADALALAMTPWVSSKRHLRVGPYGEPPNRGIGLKMIGHMLSQSCGEMFIASGDAWRHYEGGRVETGDLPKSACLPGTVLSIRFARGQIDDHVRILAEAQKAMNLTLEADDDKFFA